LTTFKCDEKCEGCSPVTKILDTIQNRLWLNSGGWDWLRYSKIEKQDDSEVDDEIKDMIKKFFQLFHFEVIMREDDPKHIEAVRVELFGGVLSAEELVGDLYLHECNDIVRKTQLREAAQRAMGAAVARLAVPGLVKWTSVQWKNYNKKYGSARNKK